MVKNKSKRTMSGIGEAQKTTEIATEDRFKDAMDLVQPGRDKFPTGRISPQISCTIRPEDQSTLNELTLYLSNKAGKVLNTSVVIRSLIKLGFERKEELKP